MDYSGTSEDVDLTLRHVSRQFPEQFARALLPPGTEVTSASWPDTQVTSRERRLDRALHVEADGELRHEHTEWQLRWFVDVPFRIFEYHNLFAMALAAEARDLGQSRGRREKLPLPRIRSTLVLLSGRKKPWPAEGEYRTSPPDAPFSGVTFRVDAVYQRTVEELFARGSTLWLIFTPLAVDADAAAMARVIGHLRAVVPLRQRNELLAAMLVIADTNEKRRGLRKVIVSLLKEESVMENWVYKQGEKQGVKKGIKKGIEKGRAEGIEKGIEKGRAEGSRKALVLFYETRFGAMPAKLRVLVEKIENAALVESWCEVVARASKEEVDATLKGNGR